MRSQELTIDQIRDEIQTRYEILVHESDKSRNSLSLMAESLIKICDGLKEKLTSAERQEGVFLEIAAEQARRAIVEGRTGEEDDGCSKGELSSAAACYAVGYLIKGFSINKRLSRTEKVEAVHRWCLWPWEWSRWKPSTRRQDLISAIALLIAEVERLDRAEARGDSSLSDKNE